MRALSCIIASMGLACAALAEPAPPPPANTTAPASIGTPHECKGHYPPQAVDEMRQGRTLLGFTITPQGTSDGVKVLKSSGHADLDLAAVACAKKWEYRPAMIDGKAVSMRWKAYVIWVDDPPSTPLQAAMRPLRSDAWRCLWESPAAKALPPDYTAWLEVHISFGNWLRKTSLDVSQSSGNAALDEAALQCVRSSPRLAEVEAVDDISIGVFVRLAWWYTGT